LIKPREGIAFTGCGKTAQRWSFERARPEAAPFQNQNADLPVFPQPVSAMPFESDKFAAFSR
jgi:hypothetical protein